ncbi:MAG: O-antigen ligase family protein, partial [Proteobacteria bacterium]|nr:O-antigen ligase family protein [Pseudomonadota bacterium]
MPVALALRIFPLLLVSVFAVLAIASPDTLFLLGQLAVIATVGSLAFVFPTTVLTIAVVSLTFSPENFLYFDQLNVPMNVGAVHKFLVLIATVPLVLRYGVNWQLNGPLVAILLFLVTGLVFGDLHPALTQFQITKSLIALLIPWLFLSVKFNDKTVDGLLLGIALMPIISVLVAIPVEMIGALNRVGAVFEMISVDYTGAARLMGMNFPAFLAFFGYVSFFVCLHKVVIENRRGFIFLALINLALTIFTGTRMPSLLAVLLAGLMIFFASKDTLKGATKINFLLLGLIFISVVMAFYWPQLEARMFAQTSDSAVNLSGREEIWSYFIAAFHESPVFGKGVGAGVVLMEDVIIYSSTAAHN